MKTTYMLFTTFLIWVVTIYKLFAVTLEWEIPINERLEIVRTAKVDYYVNKKIQKKYEERNIINLTCYAKDEMKSSVKGDFTVYVKEQDSDLFKQLEQHRADFDIKKNGKFVVAKKYFMPNLRHIPTFPEKEIKQGDEWTSPAELIFNNFSLPFMLTFNVKYTLKELQTIQGKDVAIVDYAFIMDRKFSNQQLPGDIPLRVFGKDKGRMIWDLKGKKPFMIDDDYHIVLLYRVGATEFASAEFAMKIETRNKMYQAVTPDEKIHAIREIEKELPKDSGISVDQDNRGIVVRLGEILFDFDSYRLKGEAEKNLERVSDIILKKYSDREVVVEGHTDNMGESSYNLRLSEQRANSVAKYLKGKGLSDKLSYRGFGEEKPITDNATSEGRRKNRRVEVIIKLK